MEECQVYFEPPCTSVKLMLNYILNSPFFHIYCTSLVLIATAYWPTSEGNLHNYECPHCIPLPRVEGYSGGAEVGRQEDERGV